MRHSDWCRIRFSPDSDPDAAAALIPLARTMLGQMINGLQLVDQRTGVLRRELPDGSTIQVAFDGTTPTIDIDVPAETAQVSTSDMSNLWLPRGFIVRPAWSDAPYGVGLPATMAADAGVYAEANLDPGPSRGRWTAGGPCGQVLITKDDNAGYPNADHEIAPLLYSTKGGPRLTWSGAGKIEDRPWQGTWQAFRLAFTTGRTFYSDEDRAFARQLASAINGARADAGVAACQMWPRGLYRPGQIGSYILQAARSIAGSSDAYPPTYTNFYDRLTKDGYTMEQWLRQSPQTWGRSNVPGIGELRAVGGSVAAVMAAWQADGGSQATLAGNYGNATFLDVGMRGGYAVAAFAQRDAWLDAGNATWRCDNGRSIPPLSWLSFKSMNLIWDTFPVQYSSAERTLQQVTSFTTPNGDVWLTYTSAKTNARSGQQPALGRHLYMRGRAIAMAPQGGLFWAAGMLHLDGSANDPGQERLIAIVHHPEDQPANWKDGYCRYVRVWYVDLPDAGLLANPDRVIVGTDTDDPYAWRGGQMVDLGFVPTPPIPDLATPAGVVNSLKMDSTWRIAPDGSRAACLRNFSSFDQLVAEATARDPATGDEVVWGGYPIGVELLFSTGTSGELITTTQWQPWAAGDYRNTTELPGIQIADGSAIVEQNPVPLAVDYDDQGALVYAFRGTFIYSPFGGIDEATVEYVGTGPIATAWPSDLAQLTLMATSIGLPELDFFWNGTPQVLDVRDLVVVTDGMHPRLSFQAGYIEARSAAAANPAFASCKQFMDEGEIHGVRSIRAGAVLGTKWFGCPDGVVFQNYWFCDSDSPVSPGQWMVTYPTSVAANVQAEYATYRGDWLLGYQLAPQPAMVHVRDDANTDDGCGCQTTYQDVQDRSHLMELSEYLPRGGGSFSSFDVPSAVRGGWLIESKCL